MSEDGESKAPSPKAKPGRKPALPITDKVVMLKAQLAEAEAEARAHQKEVAAIVGRTVIEAMTEDEKLKSTVTALLRSKVKSPKDKATIAVLLI